jgi:mono/diheme cytochrome c family protein
MSTHTDVEKMEGRSKVWLLTVSVITLVTLVFAAVKENFLAEWQVLQTRYAEVLKQKATDEMGRDIANQFAVQFRQNVVPQLGRTDRCITCHLGIDDPRMADQGQPYSPHPGRYLAIHDPSKFGCTICHQGQGLATDKEDAHGRAPFWDYPLLKRENMKAACTRCHEIGVLEAGLLVQADTDGRSKWSDPVILGKMLAESKGCFGCHMLNGKGGTLGPELTYVGDKSPHEFDFSHFDKAEPREVDHWLKKHFLEPNEISPGTMMPEMGLNTAEADALTAYMLSLRRPVRVPEYRDSEIGETHVEQTGKHLYRKNCAACHGIDGQQSEVPGIRTPALNNTDALSAADADYYRSIILHGRGGSAMPAWGPGKGNLSSEEIDLIVTYIRSWQREGAQTEAVHAEAGDAKIGKSLFSGLCGNCHGRSGEGGIGNALKSPTFLAIASDRFLAETIIDGRPGTAMAGWKYLSAQSVSDILAYMRSWQPVVSSYEDVQNKLKNRKALAGVGQFLYEGNCAVCHGQGGEGGMGVQLNTPDLLRVVDDRYLYRALTEGRPNTAMPAWRHLSSDEIAALIAYVRTFDNRSRVKIAAAPPRGDFSVGEVHYRTSCQSCHGDQGIGGVGPRLANASWLDSASDDVLYHWISQGRSGTAMKGFLKINQGPTGLTREQIADVIAYLRHLATRESLPLLKLGMGDASVGEAIYGGSCSACHGVDGEGASGPQLNNANFLSSASNGFLAATMALGRSGTAMRSMVHGQEGLGQIAPAQVADVIAYLRTWQLRDDPRKQRAVVELTSSAIGVGKALFGNFCLGCHGPNGRGVQDGPAYFAPALNNREFLTSASDGFLLATIARGRSRTPMRPFGEGAGGIASLKSEQISDIVSYIRSWQK